MRHWIAFSLCASLWFAPACQPENACHGGRVAVNGSCVFKAPTKDAGTADPEQDTGTSTDAGDARDAGEGLDAGDMDASMEDAGTDGSVADSGMMDAGQVPMEILQCALRTPLVDEAKYGVACSPVDAPSPCGSLTCQTGADYCTKSCTVGNACSCPAGNECVSFGGAATACVPTWGRACTSNATCRAQAPLCAKGANYCTSVCDPANAKTCPDTWSCAATPSGNYCVKPAPRFPTETLQCAARLPLPDETKYGLSCSATDSPSKCGSLTCQAGANYCTKTCTVGDACSCPAGNECVSFGAGPGATACVPTWGRTCTADSGCRAQAPLCAKGPNYCTSACDPANAKTCPDTWSCAVTPGGNYCVKPPPPPAETLQCAARVPLTDEAKYGQTCNPTDAPSTCGSLTCQAGANYCTANCTLGDACTCPAGYMCTSFGGPTACVPTWGRTCTSDTTCRAQAPLCVKGPNYCTSTCNPSLANTCPDSWSCAVTPAGSFCVKP